MSKVNLLPTDFTPLQALSQTRKGGIYNIRGIVYQVHYTIWRLVSEFTSSSTPDNLVFHPEGVEDLDYYILLAPTKNEHVQIKCLNSSLDSEQFADSILPNLLEVYELKPSSQFKIVCNQPISGGKMTHLKNFAHYHKVLPNDASTFWAQKIRKHAPEIKDDIILDFLSKIRFEQHSETDLLNESNKILVRHFNITLGNEKQFFQSLFYAVLGWSKEQSSIRYEDLLKVIQLTRDDRFENNALREGWISEIFFDLQTDPLIANSYFEGKAARPHHIAAGLPVDRPDWEQEIIHSLRDFDVTIIQSSSGQGKSTLAWQTARTLQKRGFTVYELLEANISGINDLTLFLESRLKIGITPLVVIDGLNDRVRGWADLAARAQNLRGVKFLVTTREEDWFRYGQNTSRLFLKPIHLKLQENEARKIFDSFKKRNLVHPEMPNWQIAWEKVKFGKLLLEFVYLITKGKMVRERLAEQLQVMRHEPENAPKKSVLRLVAMADVLGLRIRTAHLTRFIKEQIGSQVDQNDLLRSLQDEYQVQIEGKFYTEGLHPVRSRHLVDLLHETLPLDETLVQLLNVLEANSLLNFAINAPRMLQSDAQREYFFNKLSEQIADKPYSEIEMIIKGLFGSDAHNHWNQNNAIYDHVNTIGLEIYAALRLPFGELDPDNFKFISDANSEFATNLSKIKELDIIHSNTYIFLRSLYNKIKNHPLQLSISGAAAIDRWFNRYGFPAGLVNRLNVVDLENAMHNLPSEVLCMEILGIHLINPHLLQEFYNVFGVQLKTKLLRETDSLTIEEKDSDTLKIRYIVNEEKPVNEQSVSRIKSIAYCLPVYKTYDIAGIYFPNPFLKEIRSSYDGSIKHATWENWLKHDEFKTSANATWLSVITHNYEFQTHFEWQQYLLDYRQIFLEWSRQCCRVLEAKLSSPNRVIQEINKWKDICEKLLSAKEKGRRIRYDDAHFTKERFSGFVKKISEWESMSQILPIQFSKLSIDDNVRRVLCLNLRDMLTKLPEMQSAFREIAAQTGNYFDIDILEQQETVILKKLSDICQFSHHCFFPNPKLILRPHQAVKEWFETKQKEDFQKLNTVKTIFDLSTGYELILPSSIIEEAYYNSIVLGIRGISIQELEANSIVIFTSLLELLEVNAVFFYIILVKDDTAAKNVTFRFSDDSLRRLSEIIDGQDVNLPQPFILPMPLTPEILQYLPKIKMGNTEQNVEKNVIFMLHYALWRYSEISIRLTLSGTESLKKEKLETEKQDIYNYLFELQNLSKELYIKYEFIAISVINENLLFDEIACNRFFYEDIHSSTS